MTLDLLIYFLRGNKHLFEFERKAVWKALIQAESQIVFPLRFMGLETNPGPLPFFLIFLL